MSTREVTEQPSWGQARRARHEFSRQWIVFESSCTFVKTVGSWTRSPSALARGVSWLRSRLSTRPGFSTIKAYQPPYHQELPVTSRMAWTVGLQNQCRAAFSTTPTPLRTPTQMFLTQAYKHHTKYHHHMRPYPVENTGSRPLSHSQAAEGWISSWVGDDQRIPGVVCFLRFFSFCFDLLSVDLTRDRCLLIWL